MANSNTRIRVTFPAGSEEVFYAADWKMGVHGQLVISGWRREDGIRKLLPVAEFAAGQWEGVNRESARSVTKR